MVDSTENTEEPNYLESIYDRYISFFVKEKKQPHSVEEFCKDIEIEENEFYKHFHSFAHLERSFWQFLLTATIDSLKVQEDYESYNVKDKVLSFFFTWIEVIKPQKEFIEELYNQKGNFSMTPRRMNVLNSSLESHFIELMKEGEEKEEIASRMFLNNLYPKAFWTHFVFLTNYWLKDTSEDSEKTDVAIEKSVQVIFDLIMPNALESVWDFGKFMFKEIVGKDKK